MPFNGSGVFQRVRNWVADATAGIKIRADYHDAEDDGFAAGLTNCITKDGQSLVTQNIPFNSKRITGLADPVNPQDAATKKYADDKFGGGGKMTGDLEIEKDGPTLTLDDTDDAGNSIIGQHKGKNRWIMHLGNATLETGTGNVGSDFDLLPFADDGITGLGTAMLFNRATGLGTVKGPPTADLGIATKKYADDASNPRVLRAGDTMTGELVSANSAVIATGGPVGSFKVVTATTNAAMSFLVPGFGANFGMASDGNFYMGGWSHGAVAYRFWTTKDFTALPAAVLNARLAYAGAVATATGPQNTNYEPYYGAAMVGWSWTIFNGVPVISGMSFRNVQIYTTSWFTVGTA